MLKIIDALVKKVGITLLVIFLLGCNSSSSEVKNVNNASWTKVSAYTKCKMSYGAPNCVVSIDMPDSKLHTHFLETDVNEITRGDTLKFSTFDKDSKALKSAKTYKIVDIVLEGDTCRLVINSIKYEDEFISVEGCKAS